VVVHPVSLRAAAISEPRDGLEAKFSIPWLVDYAIAEGAPTVATFRVQPGAMRREVAVRTDDSVLESEARIDADGTCIATVEVALGSPARPLDETRLSAKRSALAGSVLEGALDELGRPAADLLASSYR
jgi:hypothetical protein